MTKNKNKSGFTLVEVVVVMTMLTIILGAILNFLQPIDRSFKTAKAVAQTNQVGSTLNRYIEGQIRFSTNMLVLEDYSGVPEISTNGTFDSMASKVSYTDCLILDNNNIRGSQDPAYVANSTTPRRMGCTGTIIHVSKLNKEGMNMNNARIAMGEDFYGTETYNFDCKLTTTDNYSTLDVVTKGYQYSYRNGHIVFDTKQRFDSKKSFDLININNDIHDKRVAVSKNMKDEPSAYTDFPRSAPSATSAPGLAALYDNDPSKTYTYIFYTKANEITCNLLFKTNLSVATGGWEKIVPVTMGQRLSSGKVPLIPKINGYQEPDGYICKAGPDDCVNKVYKSANDWKSLYVNSDMIFEAVYTKTNASSQYKVIFYNIDGSIPSWLQPDGYAWANGGSPSLNTCGWKPDDYDENTGDWVGWYSADGIAYEDYELTSNNVEFYPHIVPKPTVTFISNGVTVGTQTATTNAKFQLSKAPSGLSITNAPEGMHFYEWNTAADGSGISLADYDKITGDVTFYAVFKDIPAVTGINLQKQSPDEQFVYVSHDNAANKNVNKAKVTVRGQVNKDHGDSSKYDGVVKVVITFNKSVEGCNINVSGCDEHTVSANQVTLIWNNGQFNKTENYNPNFVCEVVGNDTFFESENEAHKITLASGEDSMKLVLG